MRRFVQCLLFLPCLALAQEPAETPEYWVPDFYPGPIVWEAARANVRPIVALIGDYTWFDQDPASVGQVGVQENTRDLRAARFGAIIGSTGAYNWDFYVAVDYQEERAREDAVLQLYDLRLGLPIGKTRLTIGKQKQSFAYEMVSLSVFAPQQERILSPFFTSRSIGAQLAGNALGERMTWSAGVYNDWLDTDLSYSENARDIATRVTTVPLISSDNLHFLHLGLGYRHVGDDAGYLRFSGRPESNIADRYLDTGEFEGHSADQLSLEVVAAAGPLSLVAEVVEARVDAPGSGNPDFSGSYLLCSWMITGEGRVYNRRLGYGGGVVPSRSGGALEFVMRFSQVDLDDGLVDGGDLDKWHLGLNWWASRQWKLGLSLGSADLEQTGVTGNTKMLLARVQWVL